MHVDAHKYADRSKGKSSEWLQTTAQCKGQGRRITGKGKINREKESRQSQSKKNTKFSLYAYYHKRKMFKHLPSASKIHVIK